MKWRSWILPVHRDLGYFFTGVTVIYAVSGIAVNHVGDWDPSFVITRHDVSLELPHAPNEITEPIIKDCLTKVGEEGNYRSFDLISSKRLKIYLKEGDMVVDLANGQGTHETIRPRPVLHRFNMLHLKPKTWWKVFSDIFAVGLILIVITGLFVARGRKGLLGRGKWFVGAGLLIPLAALLAFF